MSYQVLARKWRPKTFQQLMGQEHVVTVLVNALSQKRLHHAYLFTGTRGVGKTTIARIFAKSLNCQQGITATPCGECDACIDIDQGRFVDLLEIDAASRTKVDDTREILDNVQYAPSRGRYKVYLIDEVHMLSRSSFNALLKTLEEPPEHVKFILATTDPQKLPITVLSRCLQFHLKALTVSQIEQQLMETLAQEKITHDAGTLTLLAKAARGSMRDALSLTDQSIAQGQGVISIANVQQMLGGVDQNWVYKILILLIKQDSAALMALSQEIASYAPNYARLLAELIQLLHHIALAQIVDLQFDLSAEQASLLRKFCQAISAEDVQLYYQIALNGRKDLPYAANEQAAFDMVLLRLLAFKPMQYADAKVTPVQLTDVPDFDDVELADTQISGNNNDYQSDKTAQESHATHAIPDESDNIETVKSIDNVLEPSVSITPSARMDDALSLEQVSSTETEQVLDAEMLAIERSAQEQGMMTSDNIPCENSNDIIGQELSSSESNEIEPDLFNTTIEELVSNDSQIYNESQSGNPPLALDDTAGNLQGETIAPQLDAEPIHKVEEVTASNIESSPNNAPLLATQEVEENQYASPLEAVLATRNMLRSRKKQLEDKPKKPSDANARHEITPDTQQELETKNKDSSVTAVKPKNKLPDLESLPEQPYSPDIIDPTSIRFANQVDRWANMIDTMALTARVRQLAIHATIGENSTDDLLVLNLDQSTKHLFSEAAHQQLEQSISTFLTRKVTVEVNIVEQTIADPYQIQTDINDKRLEYAIALIHDDDAVKTLQQEFQAELDESSIVAR
ncbi:DNA polymerase III subunit gamma/tau [Colwelliaceae bacterium 6471]